MKHGGGILTAFSYSNFRKGFKTLIKPESYEQSKIAIVLVIMYAVLAALFLIADAVNGGIFLQFLTLVGYFLILCIYGQRLNARKETDKEQ